MLFPPTLSVLDEQRCHGILNSCRIYSYIAYSWILDITKATGIKNMDTFLISIVVEDADPSSRRTLTNLVALLAKKENICFSL